MNHHWGVDCYKSVDVETKKEINNDKSVEIVKSELFTEIHDNLFATKQKN